MLRVLWLSNVDLRNTNPNSSGTWITSMYSSLMQFTKISVCANISLGSVKAVEKHLVEGANHFLIPRSYIKRDGTPSKVMYTIIREIINEENPDIIHVWGTEMCWGSIITELEINHIPKLLEIQGLIYYVEKSYYGGLCESQIKRMRGLIEYIWPNSKLENKKKAFSKLSGRELAIIQSFDYINVQSNWVRNYLETVAPSKKLFSTDIILRKSFLEGALWSSIHKATDTPILFSTASAIPYKGIHDTIFAFSLIKKRFPMAQLRIAGVSINNRNWKNNGYIQYVVRLCKDLYLSDSITFVGYLNEKQLVEEMYLADVFLISSYVESYCLALAEALSIGLPCVAPYNSALVELIHPGLNGELYPTGDYYMCSKKITSLLEDKEKAISYGNKAATIQRKRSNPMVVAKNQEEIYLSVKKL